MTITNLVGNISVDLVKTAEKLIDPTSLAIILGYITSPHSDIDFAINVVDKDDLPFVSAFVSSENNIAEGEFAKQFASLIESKKVVVLTRSDFKKIPSNTLCWCIQQPPAYIISIDETKTYS